MIYTKDWLMKHNYDGLYCPDAECACKLSDLYPCVEDTDDPKPQCKPGYLKNCKKCLSTTDCDSYFCISGLTTDKEMEIKNGKN